MKIYFTLFISLFVIQFCLGQTRLQGKITDEETEEELIGANLQLLKKGLFITGMSTDFDGNYKISLDPGTYDAIASYIGFPDKRINGVIVNEGETNLLDIQFTTGEMILTCCLYSCYYYPIPLIDKNNTTSGQKITSKTIQREPNRSVKNIALNVAGLSTY